jgi:hypothetical protein
MCGGLAAVFAGLTGQEVAATNTVEQKFFYHQSNTEEKTDFHFTAYSDINMKLDSASSNFPNSGHNANPQSRKEHTFNWTGLNVPQCTIIQFYVKFTQNVKNYLRFKDVYWTPEKKNTPVRGPVVDEKVPGPPGFMFGPTYGTKIQYRIFNDTDTSMTVRGLQFMSSVTHIDIDTASYPMSGFGDTVPDFVLNAGESWDTVLDVSLFKSNQPLSPGFILAQGVAFLDPEETPFLQEHEELDVTGIPVYTVNAGSVNNDMAIDVCNLSDFYPLTQCSVEVAVTPSFVSSITPTVSATSPQDIPPAHTGTADFLFDIAPSAVPGDSQHIVFTVRNSQGEESTREFALVVFSESCCIGIRGNVDGDIGDNTNVADLTYLVDFLFRGGPAPPCLDEADVDGGGGSPNVADLTYLVDYLFRGGPPPPPCP